MRALPVRTNIFVCSSDYATANASPSVGVYRLFQL